MSTEEQVLKSLVAEFDRRVYEEGFARIQKCLSFFHEEEVWQRPNENAVSIGNLILHLSGNVRQWICAGFGGQADIRTRDQEFAAEGGYSKDELISIIEQTIKDAQAVLHEASTADLMAIKKVQVYEESGLSIIVHVIEHFSYHIGQITYATKAIKNVDTKYYPEDLG